MIIVSTEVKKFINQLQKPAVAKCSRMMTLLDCFRHNLTMPHSKAIGQNLFELRIRGKQEVRLVYTFQNDNIILFYGFVKKSQRIPPHELINIYKKLNQVKLDYI